MCLNVVGYRCTAKEDMTVYKVLNHHHVSPYFNFHYHGGVTYTSPMRRDRKKVGEGFHAFVDRVSVDTFLKLINRRLEATSRLDGDFDGYAVHEFVIPKGAHYYVGDNDDIVSDQIQLSAVQATALP